MKQFALVGVLGGALVQAYEPPACRWAANFNDPSIFRDLSSSTYKDYVDQFLRGEAQWIRGLGTEPNQGWTLDGQRLDVLTGRPFGDPHNWTASSKECMQMFLIARILYDSAQSGGDCLACKIWTKDEALALLRKKMAAYKQYDSEFPGFGGWFPWMKIDLATGHAAPDAPAWANHVPALDNAELFWPLWAVYKVLEDLYRSEGALIADVQRSVNLMLDTGKAVFYNKTKPGIRTDSYFTDQTQPVTDNVYQECSPDTPPRCVHNYLDDTYEGELFLDMIAAFADEMHFDETEVADLWEAKRAKTQIASVIINGEEYETELGWTFSSHEKWKYLMVPYLESRMQQNVFYSGEKIRTMYANAKGYAGLWGAMTGPMSDNYVDSGYWASVGIPPLAMNSPVQRFDLVTPYGAYPVILANESVGMAWIHNMITAPRGQNCFGTTEGFKTNGLQVASIVTWDTKVTNVMALLGGIGDITKEYLKKEGRLDLLVALWEDQWAAFGNLKGYDKSEFEYPVHKMPNILPDYTSCRNRDLVCGEEGPLSTEPDTTQAFEAGGASPSVIGFSLAVAGLITAAFLSA